MQRGKVLIYVLFTRQAQKIALYRGLNMISNSL